jgi:hypothetical protein
VARFTYWYVILIAACGNVPPSPSGGGGGAAAGGGASAGGGSGQVTVRQALSGSRLLTRVIVGDDGSEAFNGDWFDTQRGEACSFRTAADGQLRCLPRLYPATLAYTDPACTVPVFIGDCQTAYATPIGELVACPQKPTVHPATPIAPPAAAYSLGTGVCQALPAIAPSGWYSFGAEIDAGEFVAGTVVVRDGGI